MSVSRLKQKYFASPVWIQVRYWTVGKWRWVFMSVVLLTLCGTYSCVPVSSEVESGTAPHTSGTEIEPLPSTESSPSTEIEEKSRTQIQGQMLPITAEVELGGQKIGLEVALTRQQQAIGLMYRDAMPDDRGMWFPISPARPVSFWMRNVRISLDMIFIYDGQIVAIANEVPPCITDPCPTYGPGSQVVESVIELRGGRARELGIEVGDDVDIFVLENATEMPQ